MKTKLFSFVLSLVILFLTFSHTAQATGYSYSAANFQSTGCLTGSEFTQFNLTSTGDVITITGTGFGDRNLDDSNPEMVYIPTSNGVVSISQSQGLISWHDSEIQLKVNSGQGSSLGSYVILRTYPGTRPDANGSLSQSDCNRGTLATYVPPPLTCTSFTYSDWGACTNGQQTRTIVTASPSGCTGGSSILTQSCTPACSASNYSCVEWGACSASGQQTRTCTKTSTCEGGISMPAISQSCTYTAPTCTAWMYSDWSACSSGGQQTRTISSSSPTGCAGGNPVVLQACVPAPRITAVSPSMINLGDQIEINGENFGDRLNNNGRVLIAGSGEAQTVVSWSNTKIRAKIDSIDEFLKVEKDNLDLRGFTVTTIALKIKCQAPCGSGINPNGVASDGVDYIVGPSPIIKVLKPVSSCVADTWSCGDWGSCSALGNQTRICTKTFDCPTAVTPSPAISQSCIYVPPVCTSWTYSNWGTCSIDGQQTRDILSSGPANCIGGNPTLRQNCTPLCTNDVWSCGSWGTCSGNGLQNRTCTITSDCPTVATPSPGTVQACTPVQPACNADVWTCGAWGSCSLSGIQNRSCSKSFDCPDVQTAPPTTDQSCEAPNRPQQSPPSDSGEVANQDTIVKATVKLICPFDAQRGSQGSGTIIDPSGIILTNKHVIAGTVGCFVGFVDNFGDEPYFGARHIADIIKTSPTQDIAILQIRNPQNKRLPSVAISGANSNLRLGTRIVTYGYPALFGSNMTYTSGDFSGTEDVYLKTTAIIEHGNSGGGAYITNGSYIGIPSKVRKGELNALGYILSVNTIKAWMGNAPVAYGGTNNNYSRVSVLEDIDLKKLGSLKLFIPPTDAKGDLVVPVVTQSAPTPAVTNTIPKKASSPKEQPKTKQVEKPQGESIVIESPDQKQNSTVQQSAPVPEKSQPQKISRAKRFFRWAVNIFKR